MEYPKYIVNIMLSPQFYSLDEKNKNIFLRGKFMWGSTIKVNGQIIKPHYFNATHGLIEFKNNFTKEGKNSVVLIDPQRIMSNEQFFWKISKPLITAIHPTSFKIIDSSKILQFSNLNVEWVGPKVKKVIIQLEREKVPTEKTTINNGSIVKSKPIIILPIQNADSATKMKVFEIPSTKFSQTGNQVQVYVPNSFLTHPGKLIITFYSDLSAIEQQIAVIHAPGNKLFQKRKNFQRPTLTKPGGLNKPSGGKK